MYHGLRLHLSRSIVSHTHDMWYLARVIDDNFTHTSEVVLSRTWRTIVVQELGFVCMSNLYSSRTSYKRNLGIISDTSTSGWWPYLFIQPCPTCDICQWHLCVFNYLMHICVIGNYRVTRGT